MDMTWLLAIAMIAALAWGVWIFNRLVRARNQVRTAWSDIDVQLTRRHDLVPQLVAIVRAYAGHEKALLENVTALRTRAIATDRPGRLAEIEDGLEQALGRLMLLKEDYPDLKASRNFLQFQHDLVEIEDHLQYARRFYNGAVREFNDRVMQIPDRFIAALFRFRAAEFYAADEAHRATPAVGAEKS